MIGRATISNMKKCKNCNRIDGWAQNIHNSYDGVHIRQIHLDYRGFCSYCHVASRRSLIPQIRSNPKATKSSAARGKVEVGAVGHKG